METTISEKPVKNTKRLRKTKITTMIRQKKVIADMTLNNRTITDAMRNNGYKEGYSPAKLQKTKTWQELLERDLPDKLLSKVAKQGLKAKTGDKVKDLEIRHKYLETGLKMKGKLKVDDSPAGMVGLVVGFKMVTPKDTAEVIDGETL